MANELIGPLITVRVNGEELKYVSAGDPIALKAALDALEKRKQERSIGEVLAEECILESTEHLGKQIHWTKRRLQWPNGGVVTDELTLTGVRKWLAGVADHAVRRAFKAASERLVAHRCINGRFEPYNVDQCDKCRDRINPSGAACTIQELCDQLNAKKT